MFIRASSVMACAIGWVLLTLAGCGGDDDDADKGGASARACQNTCESLLGSCDLPAPSATDCAGLCRAVDSVVPACTQQFDAYVTCAGARPSVQCTGRQITLTISSNCGDQLWAYWTCAGAQIFPACLNAPLTDPECQREDLGNRAVICLGKPDNCQLFEGTSRAGGLGTYCCP
jgi:hypothetical protein